MIPTSPPDPPSSLASEVPAAETPVVFPLAPLDPSIASAFHDEWRRHDLPRYLQRWNGAYVPPIPPEIWDFSWRACDIGCGQGRFLLLESATSPDRAFLGIDKGSRRASIMLERFRASKRPNLFPLHGHAVPILASLPPNSFDLLTLFYQNPWWPKKHRKKRWPWHPIFPTMIHLLKPSGEIWFTSNEAFSLQEWLYALTSHPLVAPLVEPLYIGPIQETSGRTHFEQKFLSASIPCGEIRFRKRP